MHNHHMKSNALWGTMLGAMLLLQSTIFADYWGDFADNTWAVHVHYWAATAWFLLLITQPWRIKSGRLDSHRTWGIIGVGLAGGFAFTSISQFNRDLFYANLVTENPGAIGPFEAWFFFGIAISEMILVSAFMVAVTMAVLKRRQAAEHGWWMMSTASIVMFPALGRGLQGLWIAVYGFDPAIDVVVMTPIYVSQGLIIVLTAGVAAYFSVLRHPATYLALGANAAVMLMDPLGRSELLQAALRAVIKV